MIPNVGVDVGKGKLSYVVGGCANLCSYFGNQSGGFFILIFIHLF